jgi:hypothetical protein
MHLPYMRRLDAVLALSIFPACCPLSFPKELARVVFPSWYPIFLPAGMLD